MKQNKYNDLGFFENYSKMPRSVEGLNAAGEWSVLRKMLPDFRKKSVLDLGCGFGWHCLYAFENGASRIIGIDISEKMLEKAKRNSKNTNIEYMQMAIEDINFDENKFDIIISSLAFHYIQDFRLICSKIYTYLKKGGVFVFSIEHPVFTARAEQDWFVDQIGSRLHWPLDNYQKEGERETKFLGHNVIKYHRTLETVINTLIQANFKITKIAEPKPAQEILDKYPEMKDESRRPIFLLVSAVKTE